MSDIGGHLKEWLRSAPLPPVQSGLRPLFGPLKDHMRGQNYENDEVVYLVMYSWLPSVGMDFDLNGIFKLVQHWQKCMDRS